MSVTKALASSAQLTVYIILVAQHIQDSQQAQRAAGTALCSKAQCSSASLLIQGTMQLRQPFDPGHNAAVTAF